MLELVGGARNEYRQMNYVEFEINIVPIWSMAAIEVFL
jgi:hypothetical protein